MRHLHPNVNEASKYNVPKDVARGAQGGEKQRGKVQRWESPVAYQCYHPHAQVRGGAKAVKAGDGTSMHRAEVEEARRNEVMANIRGTDKWHSRWQGGFKGSAVGTPAFEGRRKK